MGRFHRHDDGTVHEHPVGVSEAGDDGSHGHASGDRGDHGDLSGYRTAPERVVVLERIFGENDRLAEANRAAFDSAGVTAINVMSSPGAGKTAILRHTLAHVAGGDKVAIIEGDIETSLDADRLSGFGAQVALVNTSDGFGGECHLDAPMVASALPRLDLAAADLLFIENVGNLVCPAEFDVGAHHRVMVYAITEGEEKPLKYPVMFRSVDLVLVNKLDLLPHLDFDLPLFLGNLARVNPAATVLQVSARTTEGLGAWYAWLDGLGTHRGA
jgi:hydrogenase nickel incorporation protein HypB